MKCIVGVRVRGARRTVAMSLLWVGSTSARMQAVLEVAAALFPLSAGRAEAGADACCHLVRPDPDDGLHHHHPHRLGGAERAGVGPRGHHRRADDLLLHLPLGVSELARPACSYGQQRLVMCSKMTVGGKSEAHLAAWCPSRVLVPLHGPADLSCLERIEPDRRCYSFSFCLAGTSSRL